MACTHDVLERRGHVVVTIFKTIVTYYSMDTVGHDFVLSDGAAALIGSEMLKYLVVFHFQEGLNNSLCLLQYEYVASNSIC